MKKVEMNLNGSTLSIETGHVARQSSGSVIVTHGESSVLVAVNAAKEMREDIDFFHSKSNTEKDTMLVEKSPAVSLKEKPGHRSMKF